MHYLMWSHCQADAKDDSFSQRGTRRTESVLRPCCEHCRPIAARLDAQSTWVCDNEDPASMPAIWPLARSPLSCAESEEVVVTPTQAIAAGSEVRLNDARPNGERLLATGFIERKNPANFLLYEAELVQTDNLYTAKHEVLQASGLQVRSATAPLCPGSDCHRCVC